MRQTAGKPTQSNKVHLSEDIYMTFNHPSSPPAFASLTKPDLVLLKDVAMVDRLQLTVTSMKENERKLLSEVQLG